MWQLLEARLVKETAPKRVKSKLNAREVEVKQAISKLQLRNIITRNLSKYHALVQKKKKFRRKKSSILRRSSKSTRAALQ